jgi:Na+/proline symporter
MSTCNILTNWTSLQLTLTAEFAYPMLTNASPSTITWIGRVVAIILVIIALIIGLVWDKGLTDLRKVQFGISLQCIPSFIIGLFAWKATGCHPWILTAGG